MSEKKLEYPATGEIRRVRYPYLTSKCVACVYRDRAKAETDSDYCVAHKENLYIAASLVFECLDYKPDKVLLRYKQEIKEDFYDKIRDKTTVNFPEPWNLRDDEIK